MRRFLRDQGLSLVFLGLFLAALSGQAVAGWHDYNNLESWHARMAGEAPQTLSFGRYLTSSSFAQAVTENWQSEYLQFTASRTTSSSWGTPHGRTRRCGRAPAAGARSSTRTRS